MEYCEVKVFIKMKEDVESDKIYGALNGFVNSALLKDVRLKKVHEINAFKFYTYSLPYPVENDRVYHKGRVYCFNIRSVNNELAARLEKGLGAGCDKFAVEGKQRRSYRMGKIEKLVTLTPVVVTMEAGVYWKREDGADELIKRLSSNGERKVKAYFGEDKLLREESFIESIVQKNNRLIQVPYKEGCLFGNKFVIDVKEDERSQFIARFVNAVGLGEKNALGMGYCRAIYDDGR